MIRRRVSAHWCRLPLLCRFTFQPSPSTTHSQRRRWFDRCGKCFRRAPLQMAIVHRLSVRRCEPELADDRNAVCAVVATGNHTCTRDGERRNNPPYWWARGQIRPIVQTVPLPDPGALPEGEPISSQEVLLHLASLRSSSSRTAKGRGFGSVPMN